MTGREQVVASISGDSWVIECTGDLDQEVAAKLHTTIAWCLGTSNMTIDLDITQSEDLSREAVSVILNGMVSAHESGVGFNVIPSAEVRRFLDASGLWWVGVIDDGIAAELAMGDAFQEHLDEHRPG